MSNGSVESYRLNCAGEMAGPEQPLIVAHRAGNHLDKLAEAFALGVDYAETDVWLHRGRLEVRHEKTLGPLPLLYDRGRLFPGWKPRLLLRDVLQAALGQGKLFLDLKGAEPALPGAVASAIEQAGAEDIVAFSSPQGKLFLDLKGAEPGLPDAVASAIQQAGAEDIVAFSSPRWAFLDRLAEPLPQTARFYTISNPERLAELRPRLSRGEVEAVSIHSRMLSAEIVQELKRSGVRTMTTWAVETEAEARRVLDYGATGVTSKNLALLAAIRRGELGEAPS